MDHILDQYCIDNTGHHPYRWAKNDLKFHRVTGKKTSYSQGYISAGVSQHQSPDGVVN